MVKIGIIMNIRGSTETTTEFKPYMVNNLIKSEGIYFPENFKLDKSNILNALSKHSSDIRVILTNINYFTILVNYNTNKNNFKKIVIDGIANKDIIEHNAEFMRKLWFVNNSKITIPDAFIYKKAHIVNPNVYDIVSSKKGRVQKKKFPKKPVSNDDKYRYEMSVDIMVSKETSAAAKFALTCPDKRNELNKLYMELFDTTNNLFDWRENENSNRYLKIPRMLTNNIPGKSTSTNIMGLDRRFMEQRQMEQRLRYLPQLRPMQHYNRSFVRGGGTIRRSRQTQRRRRRSHIKYT